MALVPENEIDIRISGRHWRPHNGTIRPVWWIRILMALRLGFLAGILMLSACGDQGTVYVVSPGIDVASAVNVFNCSNVGFRDKDQAEKYSRQQPGTHVFEVNFKQVR